MPYSLPTIPPDAWEAHCQSQPRLVLQQSLPYGLTCAALGMGVEHVEGGAQIIERRFGPLRVGLVNGGPAEDWDWNAMRRAYSWHKGSALLLTPLAEPPLPPSRKIMSGASTAWLDLPWEPAHAHPKWRTNLARANAPRLRWQAETDWEWLMQNESLQRRQKKYRALPLAFWRIWKELQPDNLLWGAVLGKGSQPQAAVLCALHHPSATYAIGVTTPAGREHYAHYALMAAAAQKLTTLKIQNLDMGWIDTHHAPGIARFKLGTGAHPCTYPGTYLL